MTGLRLSNAEITQGGETLDGDKLKPSQIEDLISLFRDYLGSLAGDYSFEADLAALTDSATKNTCAKLAACLARFQENEFFNGGFAATNANRSGFNTSIDVENYKVFRYAFGLLYDIPDELDNRYLVQSSNLKPTSGRVTRIFD